MDTFYSVPKEDVKSLLLRQISSFFPTISKDEELQLDSILGEVFSKCEYNFSMSDNKYFSFDKDGERTTIFNPYHSIQWMTFLYYLSRELFIVGSPLCDKVYFLNKIINSVDLFYAIELPSVWSAEHPLGAVMGRAKYSDGFFFYQGCTVGGTSDKLGNIFYPVIEKNVCMYANSSVLGKCHIGEGVQIGAGALIKNQDIPANSIVFGQSPNLIIKENK